MANVIETASGATVDLLAPHGSDIYINDIAWGLSRIARFNGHTQGKHPYSVAQHSIWCAWAAQHWFAAKPKSALHALLHDAHEAYLGDIVMPLKRAIKIKPIEQRLQSAIYDALDLGKPDADEVALIGECDRIALAVEAHHLMSSNGKDWPCQRNLPEDALQNFWEPMSAMEMYFHFMNVWTHLDLGNALPDNLLETLA